jgi:hypothetical protein
MAPVSIASGILLILLGVGTYVLLPPNPETGHVSPTALIPAGVGLALLLLGVLALKDSLRKHAMHAAAVIGLLGFLGGGYMGFGKLMVLLAGGEVARPAAAYESSAMALICGVFVILCVRSFIMARRNRAKQQAT